jgi:hypothetical protein
MSSDYGELELVGWQLDRRMAEIRILLAYLAYLGEQMRRNRAK